MNIYLLQKIYKVKLKWQIARAKNMYKISKNILENRSMGKVSYREK